MDWYEVYLKDISKKDNIDNYITDKIKYKKPLINLIKKYAKNKKIIEAGSGTGVVSTYMASLGYDTVGIDIDLKMIDLANQIANKYNSQNKPLFEQKSIFEMDYSKNKYDVSFSNGVLEHFKDEEIIDTLKQQLDVSNTVIFGIPTKYFNQEEAMYGDERYMDFKIWRNYIKQAGGIILEEKSMHYMSFWKSLFNIKKWFRPYPFRIFVVKKGE